jgi:hypothetical protein
LVIGPILSFARTESTAYLPLCAESLPKENELQAIRSAMLQRIAVSEGTDCPRFQASNADTFTEFSDVPEKKWRRPPGAAIAIRSHSAV